MSLGHHPWDRLGEHSGIQGPARGPYRLAKQQELFREDFEMCALTVISERAHHVSWG